MRDQLMLLVETAEHEALGIRVHVLHQVLVQHVITQHDQLLVLLALAQLLLAEQSLQAQVQRLFLLVFHRQKSALSWLEVEKAL